MKINLHNPETVPQPVGNYSQAVEIEGKIRHLYISGQIPENQNGEIPNDFAGQCELIWRNIGEILRSSKMSFENLIKVTTFLTHPDQAKQNSEIRQRVLGSVKPALTVVIAQTLDSKWMLEIEAVAVAQE